MRKTLLAFLAFIGLFAPAFAEIHVYDSNGQYLGILLTQGEDYCKIYIPSIGAFAQIDDDKVISRTCSLHYAHLLYSSDDCSGNPYFEFPITKNMIYEQEGQLLKPGPNASVVDVKSQKRSPDLDCELTRMIDHPVLDIVVISSSDLPFTLPIQGPLEFRYSPDDQTGDGKVGLDDAIKALQDVSNVR